MADVSALEHNVEKPIFQNSINPDDTILNCNLLDIINVSGELEVILEGNEENSNVINKDTPKININMVSAIDKTAKNDAQIFDSTSNNLSLESHSESHRFDSLLTPYGFDKTSHKSDTLDDSMLTHVVQNPCGRDVNSFVSSSYDQEPTNPPKDSIVVFLMGQVEFLRDEIKIKNNIIERLLTLKSVLHDNQFSSYNSQQINKINKKFVDKNVDTDDIPVDYQPVTQNNKNMDIIIKELNKSLSGIDESNEAINNIVVKYPIINPVESIYEIGENKKFDAANLSQNIDFSIGSAHSDKSHADIKSRSDINLDQTDKTPFDEVADNAINQLKVLIENTKHLQSKHKELFATSKNEDPITILSDLSEPRMSNKQHTWKKGTTLIMGDSILSGLREYKMSRRKTIKVRTFPGATINDMKFFVVPLLKKKPDKVIIHVGTNDAPHFIPDEMFKNMKELRLLIQKLVPSAKIIISSPVIRVDKANSDINNKKFISLLNSTDWDCIHHENIDESHLNQYGLHINRTGSINLAKNLISGIRKF